MLVVSRKYYQQLFISFSVKLGFSSQSYLTDTIHSLSCFFLLIIGGNDANDALEKKELKI